MSFLFDGNAARSGIGIAILRIVTGIIILMHGWQKFFGMGIGGVTGFFTHVGVPMPGVMAPLVATIEIVGGIALIVGLLTRLAALGVAADLLGAIIFVHFKNGFFNPAGYEFPLLIVAAAAALTLAGPGAYALDNALAARGIGRASP
jgi:Predicted membrane protein